MARMLLVLALARAVGAPTSTDDSTDDGFTAVLGSNGGIEVRHRSGAVLYRVASSFSEPGPVSPVLHRFDLSSGGSERQGWVSLGPSASALGVTGEARDFSVTRTISVQRHAILINDTVRASLKSAPIVGMEVKHVLEVVGGQQLREATVPGAPWTFGCDSMHEDGESGRRLHRGTSGNPTIHLRSDSGGSVSVSTPHDSL